MRRGIIGIYLLKWTGSRVVETASGLVWNQRSVGGGKIFLAGTVEMFLAAALLDTWERSGFNWLSVHICGGPGTMLVDEQCILHVPDQPA